jgi:hypothetical protein
VSRGLVSLLNETEVRAILKAGTGRLREPGMVFRSFCSSLALLTLRIAPQSWINLIFVQRKPLEQQKKVLGPLSALILVLFIPFVRYFESLDLDPPHFKRRNLAKDSVFAAAQKIEQAIRLWGPSYRPGISSLYLIDPR